MEELKPRAYNDDQGSSLKRLFRRFLGGKQEPKWPSADPSIMQVTSDASRCVQCGICGYNCPVGIEVREYARRGENITDFRCIGCGACVAKCPRGTLKWGAAILVRQDNSLEISPSALPVRLGFDSRRTE